MEDVRAVLVNQDPVLVVVIVCVTTDVGTAVNQQHFAGDFGQTLGDHAACETRPTIK